MSRPVAGRAPAAASGPSIAGDRSEHVAPLWARSGPRAVGAWLATAARLTLGVVWLWAGTSKLASPDAAVLGVRAYRILPETLVKPVAWGLPTIEIALGVLLIVGIGSRIAAVLSGVVLLGYIAAIASVWARGLQIDCGCFGGGGFNAHVSGWTYLSDIARDGLLVVAAAIVAFGPASRLSLDRRLGAG